MTKEELIGALSKEIVKLLDGDWVSDEIDNMIALLPSDAGLKNDVVSLSQYDDSFGRIYREVTMLALADVLVTLNKEIPNP